MDSKKVPVASLAALGSRWALPTTAGCSDACQPSSKKDVWRRNPTVPGGIFVEGVETPWVQERAGDQHGWTGKLVRTAAKSHR